MTNLDIPEKLNKSYKFVKGLTYARGIHNLQKACEKDPLCIQPIFTTSSGKTMYCPLTLLEYMKGVVVDFNTLKDENGKERSLDDRERLLNNLWIYTSSGILNKANSSQFKLIPQSEDLVTIDKNFEGDFLTVSYNSVEGIRLDENCGEYNKRLRKDQVPEQPGWRAVAGETKEGLYVLNEFADIAFARILRRLREDRGMRFYVRTNTQNDELRPLFVHTLLLTNFEANGTTSLFYDGSFPRVAHKISRQERAEQIARLSIVSDNSEGNTSIITGQEDRGLVSIVEEEGENP